MAAFLETPPQGLSTAASRSWSEAESCFHKRLWHQVSVHLLSLLSPQAGLQSEVKAQLYANVVQEIDTKLNPVTTVTLCQLMVDSLADADEALQYLEKVSTKVKGSPEAVALARIQIANVYLLRKKDKVKTKALISDLNDEVDNLDSVGLVHEAFYKLSSEYYKEEGDHAQYYHATLRYLGCFDSKRFDKASEGETAAVTMEKNQTTALRLSLAALLGKNVFNFGELLAHPILESLRKSEYEWLINLLTAFNVGNVKVFHDMRPQWSQLVDLTQNETVLLEKIHLLALIELSFQREAKNRLITFHEVCELTGLSEDKVELLVMKALAKGLVRGHLDQVEQTITITWVQPRVLNKAQVAKLQGKLEDWCKAIKSMESLIEANGGEILTH